MTFETSLFEADGISRPNTRISSMHYSELSSIFSTADHSTTITRPTIRWLAVLAHRTAEERNICIHRSTRI